jgi:hypothetical protein
MAFRSPGLPQAADSTVSAQRQIASAERGSCSMNSRIRFSVTILKPLGSHIGNHEVKWMGGFSRVPLPGRLLIRNPQPDTMVSQERIRLRVTAPDGNWHEGYLKGDGDFVPYELEDAYWLFAPRALDVAQTHFRVTVFKACRR